jgi:hypothetical protein
LAEGAAVTHHRAIDPHRGRAAACRSIRLISSEGTLVRIIAVGGAGTIGRAVVELLSARHDVVVAGRTSGDVQVDISSPDSVRLMYEQVGRFDALVCTAGEAHFGPFQTATVRSPSSLATSSTTPSPRR